MTSLPQAGLNARAARTTGKAASSQAMPSIQKVHVVFKTHLDLGFTDSAKTVIDCYMQSYIPAAIRLARQMREAGGPERFVWTTGSWLIYEYLEQAGAADRKGMEAAIQAGDIVWHGLPFTTHTELLDPELLRYGIGLSRQLDGRFGKTTLAAKMTDVPGHTRSLVPYLAEAGIRFLHIGVNPASRPPAVPPVFRWRHPSGAEIVVVYNTVYGGTLAVPGLTDAILFAHTNDNQGPQSSDEIRRGFAQWREQFPGAEVVASTLDRFAKELLPLAPALPLVEQEIGDSWIHGTGSDPWKTAAYRELLRRRTTWIKQGRLDAASPAYQKFCRSLLLVAEHTWGMDEKTHLGDYKNYGRAEFAAARAKDQVGPDAIPAELKYAAQFRVPNPSYRKFEASWAEQREYIHQAVRALAGTPVADEARDVLSRVRPVRETDASFVPAAAPGTRYQTPHFSFKIDPQTGALNSLTALDGNRVLADARHPVGLFRYQTFSQEDYDRFLRQYVVNREMDKCGFWAIPDFSKPGLAASGAQSAWWCPRVDRILEARKTAGFAMRVGFSMPEPAVKKYGAPATLLVDYFFAAQKPRIDITLKWFDKAANRMPEAFWFSFVPLLSAPGAWEMDKLGSPVKPGEVILYGNRQLHAINTGVTYAGQNGKLEIRSHDAALVAPGHPSLLDFNRRQPDLKHGMHFNLFNNVYGSNFPMWSDEDGLFRFELEYIRSRTSASALCPGQGSRGCLVDPLQLGDP